MIKDIIEKIKKYRPTYRLDIYCATVMRLVIVLFLMQQSRFLFFTFNSILFPTTSFADLPQLMAGGFVFDLAATLYVNSLFILMQILPFRFTTTPKYQRVSKYVFVITNGLVILTNNIDIAYFPFTLRRSTSLVFKEFSNETNLWALAEQFIFDYWYLALISTTMIIGLAISFSAIKVKPLFSDKPMRYYPTAALVIPLTAILFIGGVRGGFAHSTRPITISNASQYIDNSGEESIVLNTPFSLIRTSGEEGLERVEYMPAEALNKIYNPNHHFEDKNFNKRNVVVIIWESLGSEYVSRYNGITGIDNYKGYTPFLDSLAAKSIYFTHSMSSGKKSIDAMTSIFASIPSLTQPFVLSTYSNNDIPSLPNVLKNEGYSTSFFHGAPNGSMGFLAFANKLGVEKYYGKSEYDEWRPYNKDFDGMWGIWDNDFLEFFSEKINTMKEPFFTSVFTLSSHHPFKVPARMSGLFPMGEVPIHQVMGYSDYSLKCFFERAKEQPWYDNTIFVITGDHPSQSVYSYYNTMPNVYRVPIIIYDPMLENGVERRQVASHIDIFPTVLNYLGYNKPFFSLGQNLFNGDGENYAVGYHNGYVVYYKKDYLIFNEEVIESSTTDSERSSKMEGMAKAFIQDFNGRMIDNKLK